MVLEDGLIRLSQGPKVHHTRPAIDPLFMSAADDYGDQVMGIVLSGGAGDVPGAFAQSPARAALQSSNVRMKPSNPRCPRWITLKHCPSLKLRCVLELLFLLARAFDVAKSTSAAGTRARPQSVSPIATDVNRRNHDGCED